MALKQVTTKIISDQEARIRQLEKELKWVTQERGILKEATVFFAEDGLVKSGRFISLPHLDCISAV